MPRGSPVRRFARQEVCPSGGSLTKGFTHHEVCSPGGPLYRRFTRLSGSTFYKKFASPTGGSLAKRFAHQETQPPTRPNKVRSPQGPLSMRIYTCKGRSPRGLLSTRFARSPYKTITVQGLLAKRSARHKVSSQPDSLSTGPNVLFPLIEFMGVELTLVFWD